MKLFIKILIFIILIVFTILLVTYHQKTINQYEQKIELYNDSVKMKRNIIDSLCGAYAYQLNQLDSVRNVIKIKNNAYTKERKKLLDDINNIIKLNANQQLQLLTDNINSVSDSIK